MTRKLTPAESDWFRERFIAKDDECTTLRKLVETFAVDLEEGGLAGQLLAKELRNRLAKVRQR